MTPTPSPTLHRSSASHARPVPPPVRSTAARRLAGRFRYDRRTGTWSWSPEMAALLTLARSGAQPCTELLVRSLHPEDRPRTLDAISDACTAGVPFALRVRLGGRSGDDRRAVLVGEPLLDVTGAVDALEGVLVEVPPEPAPSADAPGADGDGDGRLHALETEVAQLRTAMSSRAAIEQAKGILMLLTGCGDQVAFDLLAHLSSNSHRKVRDVAVALVGSAAGHTPLPEDIQALMRDVCPPRPQP
ncbi:ANTAR domain-containing protein [Geodermatophilus sp. DSM 44513]|uniref:ANTAR domain-containing protein n=1 Tax=Geodermatophilus sp. DSM 44513 TaxID=1528104 RepID=UPI00128604B7|nr:ANTAR domain-containing protein [Geodermatophilus sp. DSM 44513]WNV76165.1 ANTAR domain-containing protein [Geodermatophilus sp. DSM 44513]